MLDQLLEREQMIDYLDVLLKQYDGVLSAQEKIIEELEMAYTARETAQSQYPRLAPF